MQNFPQFIVIHTVKGFGIVNKTEIPNFRITVVQEVDTVEICGALKVRGAQRQLWGGEKVLKEGLA